MVKTKIFPIERCLKLILMDDETTSPIKQHCCGNNRKLFTILVVTTSFLFILWNMNIPYSVNMLGDDSFLKNISNSFYYNTIYTDEKKTIPPPVPVNVVTSVNVVNVVTSVNVVTPVNVVTSVNVTPVNVVTPLPVISYINPHNFKYLIREDNICNFTNSSVYLIVIVCVAPANLKGRVTIRETWGSVVKTNKEVKLIFMLGQTLNAQVQNQINNESSHFHDIVQEDFLDSYRNLSLKSAAMLKWSYKYCPSAKYTLKADDDMFVNIEYLLKVLKLRTLKNTVIGMQITGAQPIQNKNSKWYTPREMFNGTVYPPYCSGTSYVISGDAVERLYNTTLVTPYFWLEDIYITGICRTKANVKIFYDYGFTYEKPNAAGCVFRKRITGHRYNEREIRKIWKEFTNPSLKC